MPNRDDSHTHRRYERYVALGDSSTEGLDDPRSSEGDRVVYRGWADRFAERVAAAQGGSLLYANFALRGLSTRQVLERQLEPALALRPDLSTVFAGVNDVVSRRFDADSVAADLRTMQAALVAQGATVLSITLPDLGPVLPLAKLLRHRVEALNAAQRVIAAEVGTLLVDLAAHPMASDPRLWSEDRLHANSEGHTRIGWGLAHALGLPDACGGWADPLPAAPPRTVLGALAAEARWVGRYLIPWLWRHAHGRSSGDGLGPKRPELSPVRVVST